MSSQKMPLWCALISLISALLSAQDYTYLEENEIYQWWDDGTGIIKHFKIYASTHTEKLSVYTTDLRSAHADGHGASLTTYDYSANSNISFYCNPPSIGKGYLSIAATFGDAIQLLPGIPIHVILNEIDEMALFKFDTSSNSKILTISLTPFEGKPIAYISNTGIPNINDSSTYQYTIYSHINILINTTNTYYILMRNSVNTIKSSRFYLTASTFSTNILLQSGVPRQDDVDSGFNRYYYFNVTESNCTLGILLTVLQGHPDLFVSFNNHYPNITDYDLNSQHFGSDFILIENASINMYYIGIEPTMNENTKYTISTILKCQHNKYFTYLIDGVSQIDVLSSKQWAFYKFEFNFNYSISEILIQVNPSNGDPDLYVDIDLIHLNNTMNPKLWRYKSIQYGADHIRLSSNDFYSICNQDITNDTFCTLDIAIFGYSSTIYTIMVSMSNSHTLLINGKPNIGYISTQSQNITYYMFDIEDMNYLLNNNNITISVTPFVSTSSDIINTIFYVDGDGNQFPSENNGYKYKSHDNAHPFIRIDGNDIISNNFNELYIGVTSNTNITFSITLCIGTEIQLQDGQLMIGHVSYSHKMYYEFIINNNDKNDENIEIIATSMHGNINLYVSSKLIPDPNNSTTYDFCNQQQGVSVKRIMINNTKYNHECINNLCRYYITISTDDFGEDGEYTIIASTDRAVIPLFDGQPISSQININQYEYFSIQIDYSYKSQPVLFVDLTPMIGNVNLYISDDENNHRPNNTHYSFKSENSGHDTDSITIDLAKEGTYYISVYCVDDGQQWTFSTFSITATLSNSLYPGFIRLLSGIPQQGVISTFETSARFYQIYVSSESTLLKIHVQHQIFQINVYIAYNISNNNLPSAHNNLYNLKGGTLTIINPLEGSYFIGVYSHILSIYTITATLSNDILMLQDGISINGHVNSKKYDYYQIQTHDMNRDFTVSLTSFSGDPDLYISLKNITGSIRPTFTDYIWKSSHFGSDLITISHDDPKSCNSTTIECIYIIGVYGYRNSLYSITASTEQTIELQDGIPIQGELLKNEWNFYKFQVLNEPLMLICGVTATTGQNDLYIDLNKEPTISSYLYSSYSWNQDKNIQIEHIECPHNDDDDEDHSFCNYFIGIYGVTDSIYSVFCQSTDSDSHFLIEDSIPITRSIEADNFLFFKYIILENLKIVSISLTPISGSPQCFISSLTERPNNENYEYKIINGADTINIENVENNTIYYITMFSLSDSTFTLSVIGEHYNRTQDATGIVLIEGNTMFGSTRNWAYYSFTPSIISNHDIIISVYALSGDPDIFCNLHSYPTLNRYLYSADLDGPETLTIPHINSTYFCGIHADNNASTEFYIIAYHSHSIITLIHDIPIIGQLNIKNNINYYHFIAPSIDDDDDDGVVSIIFTPIYSSLCSIYVSYKTYHPNSTFYQYAINNTIDNGLNGIDLKIKKEELLIAKDWYITIEPNKKQQQFDVNGSSAALYTLLLTYDNVSTLQQGMPQNGQISNNHPISYYIWNIDLSDKEKEKPLSIGLSLLSGNCTIYLSRNPSMINSCQHIIGCPYGLYDIAQSCSENEPLIINANDDYYISSVGTYYISVVGTDTTSDISYYNIIVYTSYTILYLLNAIPTWDSIQLNQYKYYSLLCNDDNIINLDIVITPKLKHNFPFLIKGIISTTRSRPIGNATNNEFETQWIDNNGAVFSISENDDKFIKSSQYFISLYSIKNPDFNDDEKELSELSMIYTISAVASNDNSISYRVLIDDTEQMAIIDDSNNNKRYYSFKPTDNLKSIKCTLQVAQGNISMFIINNINNNQQINIPSSQNYQYKLENINEETTQTLFINEPCDDCSYLIVIYAESESIYSIRLTSYGYNNDDDDDNNNNSKSYNFIFYIFGVIICIIIIILSIIGFSNYKKNRKLNYELEVAELQLNMNGTKSLRQRREELQSTTNGPPQPWNKKKIKNKNKKKYSGIIDHDHDHDDDDDDDDIDNDILLNDNNLDTNDNMIH